MRYSEILEACWKGYKQAGLKKKGGRQVPNCVPVQEATDIFLDNAARDMMAVLSMMAVGFGYGIYVKIRNKLDRYQGYQIVAALEDKGVTMNRATYEKVKPVLDQFKQALKNDDGAQAKELAKRIEQMVVMGKLAAPEPQAADTAVTAKERELEEDLRKWFKEKWVRFGPDGKIRGDCARGSDTEGKPKCLPQSKAHALGKKGRASAAAKKRREDPDPERRGAAKNVATKVSEMDKSQPSQERHGDYPLGAKGTTAKPVKAKKVVKDLAKDLDNAFAFAKEKQVKEDDLDEACWKGYHKEGNKELFGKTVPNCVKNKKTNEEQGMAEEQWDSGEDVTVTQDDQSTTYQYKGCKFVINGEEAQGEAWWYEPGDTWRDADHYTYEYDEAKGIDRFYDKSGQNVFNLSATNQSQWERFVKAKAKDFVSTMVAQPNSIRMHEQSVAEGIPFDQCPQCGGEIVHESQLAEKQDACYHKVKSRYKVWPSAYASGALVQCRKKGAKNWGNKKK